MIKRNLDGIYFRIQRDGKNWEDVCWTDLTVEERFEVSKHWTFDNWRQCALMLTDVIIDIGNQLDLTTQRPEEVVTPTPEEGVETND